jgi:hypothetical protein
MPTKQRLCTRCSDGQTRSFPIIAVTMQCGNYAFRHPTPVRDRRACGDLRPLKITRRHRSKLLIPPDGQKSAEIKSSFDLPMIRTLGKAFYWQRLIDTGEVANASELARQLKLEPGWVSEVLRMTLLAPDIIQAIVEGRQPRHLNLHAVRGRDTGIPVEWNKQRKMFGFDTAA